MSPLHDQINYHRVWKHLILNNQIVTFPTGRDISLSDVKYCQLILHYEVKLDIWFGNDDDV